MKRKLLAAALCVLLLLIGCAQAEEELTPMEMMFLRGKEAVTLLAQGEVDQALELLAFVFDVESGLTEDTFRLMVEEDMTLIDSGLVQTEVAMCWLDEMGVYHIGIPLVEPASWDVEALVLDTRDMEIFCGYSLTNWAALEEAAELSAEVYWNVEYLPGNTLLMTDE